MDFRIWARNVREMLGGKRGRPPVFSAQQGYPMRIERELQHYIRRVFDDTASAMVEDALAGTVSSVDCADPVRGVAMAFDTIADMNEKEYPLPVEFDDRMKEFGRSVELFNRERMARESFMIIGERYIPPSVKEDLIFDWCTNMQVLCKTTTAQNKARISQIVGQGVARGENLENIRKEINKAVPEYSRKHAELVARTELGKLNGAIKRAQYQESGVEYYRWMSSRDDRTRESHAAMNGVICSLADPTVYYEETPDGLVRRQRTGSMVHLHPGDDFQCRCTMVMWDLEIDGKYEVKENPRVGQEPRKPTALELEREKTAKAEAEAKAAREAERQAKKQEKKAERERKQSERKAIAMQLSLRELRRRASELFVEQHFPDEKFVNENGVMVSTTRKKEATPGNEPEKFRKEMEISRDLYNNEHSIWLIPEKTDSTAGVSHPDAVMDGSFAELKMVTGKITKIWVRLKEGNEQSKGPVVVKAKRPYNVNDVVRMIKGKIVKAKADDKNFKYPFLFEEFLFISSDGKEHLISVRRIWMDT